VQQAILNMKAGVCETQSSKSKKFAEATQSFTQARTEYSAFRSTKKECGKNNV